MGDWLADTVEAAELMASTMERARAAPKLVTAELHAMALGMSDQTKELMDKFRELGKASRTPGRGTAIAGPRPGGLVATMLTPLSNTGVNYLKGAKTPRGKS
jgi:hypothetical protein